MEFWLHLKSKGVLFPVRPETFRIEESEEDDLWIMGDGTNEVAIDRHTLDIFVSQMEETIRHKETFMVFDENAPKFKMRLSGREDLPTDVDLE